jgi:organic radical activating enzyme
MNNIHCPLAAGALSIDIKSTDKIRLQQCCIRRGPYPDDHPKSNRINFFGRLEVEHGENVWNQPDLQLLRDKFDRGEWDTGCLVCKASEDAGEYESSYRWESLKGFGHVKSNISGPVRLDLQFDIGCNFACRSCGPHLSTFWQKHLKDNNISYIGPTATNDADKMIAILDDLDLSNLKNITFCGGETLLGTGYWRVADYIASRVPKICKEQVKLCFQTNGSRPIPKYAHEILEKYWLIQLNFSIDGVAEQFEYLRWPGKWDQVTANMLDMRDSIPPNHMFLIEETTSIFNLPYRNRLQTWRDENFSENRMVDIVHFTNHYANGSFALSNMTQEYYDDFKHTPGMPWKFKENSHKIKTMIEEIEKFDKIRNQNWLDTFPILEKYYARYL